MIFVDTSALLALENRRDGRHRAALLFRDACLIQGETFLTSDYVLDETYTILRLRAGHAVAVEFGEAVRESRLLRIEHITKEILEDAWRLFRAFPDRHLSFTQCTSFALMERLGIAAAFAFDPRSRAYGRFVLRPWAGRPAPPPEGARPG